MKRVCFVILALIVSGVFLYAGILKAADPVRFASDIDNYHAVPWTIGVRLAFYLPWLEILCGLAVLVRGFRRGALTILLGLMCVFIGATVAARARGIDIKCGCFGAASSHLNFGGHLSLDVLIFAALVLLWRHESCGPAHSLSSRA